MAVEWDGRRVLVTGAQGFIGCWLAERLLDLGATVVVPRRDVDPASRFVSEGVGERCVVVAGDVGDYPEMVRVLNEHEVDSVFHLAAQTLVGTANRSPLSTFEANIRGTYVLLEACRAVGVVGRELERVVVASSITAYGGYEDRPYREPFPLKPQFPYDVSKAAADLIAQSYARMYRLPVAVTRLASVYGGGDMNWSRLVPEACVALAAGRAPEIRSDGSPQRDYLYVEDAVSAYLAVGDSLSQETFHGRAWNVGWGEPVSVLDLVARLVAVSGVDVEPDVQGEGVPDGEIDRQWLDASAIRSELGWEPSFALDEGLARTYEWYAAREAAS